MWEQILDNAFALPNGADQAALTEELLTMLGSSNPQARHDYAYTILAGWILRGNYAAATLRQMTTRLLNQLRVARQPGVIESDAVFLRSYSALLLAVIVRYDHHADFLAAHEVATILDKSLAYLELEKDLRAFVPQKGWAHATAHTADLLAVLAPHRYMRTLELSHLVYGIADKVKAQSGMVFMHEEDERLARAALVALTDPRMKESIISAWFKRLLVVLNVEQPAQGFDAKYHSAYANTKNLLRSAFFQLEFLESSDDLCNIERLREGFLDALRQFPH